MLFRSYRFLMMAGTAGMTLLGGTLFFFAPALLGQFVPEDAKVNEIGGLALRLQSAVMPLLPLGVACNMTFQAVGQSVKATFLAACRQGVFFLPLIVLLPRAFGVVGMEAAQPAADVATFLACLPVIRKFMVNLREK